MAEVGLAKRRKPDSPLVVHCPQRHRARMVIDQGIWRGGAEAGKRLGAGCAGRSPCAGKNQECQESDGKHSLTKHRRNVPGHFAALHGPVVRRCSFCPKHGTAGSLGFSFCSGAQSSREGAGGRSNFANPWCGLLAWGAPLAISEGTGSFHCVFDTCLAKPCGMGDQPVVTSAVRSPPTSGPLTRLWMLATGRCNGLAAWSKPSGGARVGISTSERRGQTIRPDCLARQDRGTPRECGAKKGPLPLSPCRLGGEKMRGSIPYLRKLVLKPKKRRL